MAARLKVRTRWWRLVVVVPFLAAAAVSCARHDDGDAPAGPTTTTEDVTTTTAGPTTTTAPGMALVRCSNPENFSIGYPRSWTQVDCSQFHRQAFEPPAATDERVAAITADVDPVPFDVATDPPGVQDLERTTLEIDGRPAVRRSYRTGPEPEFYPPGTPITFYAVDLPPAEGQRRTLFVDTVGLSGFAYEENVEVLNRMAPTVDLDRRG